MLRKRIALAATAASLAIYSFASAATIVDFKPLPVSPTMPEFQFNRALGGGIPVFRAAAGATGNGDGTLPVPNQVAGGLDAETPFIIPGIPGSAINFAAGTTEFFDSTLQFPAGLAANAPAIAAGGAFIQQLSPGTFNLFSTDPPGPQLPTLLLSGNISTASFVIGAFNAGAAFNATGVNYTGGVIFNALVAAGGTVNGNSLSFSMVDVAPPFGIAGDGFLANFTANGTGLFNVNVIPEPASLTLVALAAGALFFRRR
ncbi:MAG TPA: PEP-CTERM sorting domain-containing protein [Lacipirellulaceae bacterium]|nr:PEP-CTERM sorting domain-containing protein [Lacipirellulaceae bacterium]